MPNGAYDVVTFALDHWLKAMKEDLSEYSTMDEDKVLTFKDLSTRDKLRVGVKTRLELMSPYIDVWPQAMLVGLRHPNLLPTLRRLSEIADELWFLSGDKSTNLNWYIRRYLLTKVYILTELHMI